MIQWRLECAPGGWEVGRSWWYEWLPDRRATREYWRLRLSHSLLLFPGALQAVVGRHPDPDVHFLGFRASWMQNEVGCGSPREVSKRKEGLREIAAKPAPFPQIGLNGTYREALRGSLTSSASCIAACPPLCSVFRRRGNNCKVSTADVLPDQVVSLLIQEIYGPNPPCSEERL